MSLGSVCRLLLASELQERPLGHLKIVTEAKGHRRQGALVWCMSVMYSQVCQRLESSEGKLGKCPDVIVLNEAGENKNLSQPPVGIPDPRPATSHAPPRFQPMTLRQASILNLATLSLWRQGIQAGWFRQRDG